MLSARPDRVWLDEAGSTNAEAREQAEAGNRGPFWIAARRQTAGRGRRGRAWTGLEGNLFTTGLYTLPGDPAQAAELSFLAALAVAEVCDLALEDRARTRVKWPNDVLVDGRKVCGILLESGQAPGGGLWVAVGIGLNLTAHPDDAERPAISIAHAGGSLQREAALDHLIERFEAWRMRWQQQGFGPVRVAQAHQEVVDREHRAARAQRLHAERRREQRDGLERAPGWRARPRRPRASLARAPR